MRGGQADTAPDDGTYTHIDRRGVARVIPKGIDYGWAHAPGSTWKPDLAKYPPEIAVALKKDLTSSANGAIVQSSSGGIQQATPTAKNLAMNGSEKQVKYATEIVEKLREHAQMVTTNPPAGWSPRTIEIRAEEARRMMDELAVLDAVSAGDMAAAEKAFARVAEGNGIRAEALQEIVQSGTIDAGRLIDFYKKAFYSVSK